MCKATLDLLFLPDVKTSLRPTAAALMQSGEAWYHTLRAWGGEGGREGGEGGLPSRVGCGVGNGVCGG